MANIEGMIKEAIKAYRKGNRAEARALLEKAVELDQYNEHAWLWLSAVVETPEEQRTCLENVLVINANNESAKAQLAKLDTQIGGGVVDSDFEDIFSDIDFSQGTAFVAPSTKTASPFDDDMASNDDASGWEAPPTASSAPSSMSFQAYEEPSDEDYDQWMSNLNLGSGQTSEPPAFESSDTSAPAFDDVDTLFGNEEEDDPFAEAFDSMSSGSTSPFAAPVIEETPPPVFTEPPSAPVPPTPPAPPENASMTSPVSPTAPIAAEVDSLGGAAFVGEQYRDDYEEFDTGDAESYFRELPKKLKPGRLPGEVERYPPLVLVGVAVLILMNLGALGFVISRLAG